jgi:hypothetical protein
MDSWRSTSAETCSGINQVFQVAAIPQVAVACSGDN